MSTIDEIGAAIMRWQDLTQAFDEAAADKLGISLRELRCLGSLHHGPRSPSELATGVKLSPAAMTALLDRLEKKDLVRRRRDMSDRRKVLIEQTEKAKRFSEDFYGQIARDGASLLSSLEASEQEAILRFIKNAIALQERRLGPTTAAS